MAKTTYLQIDLLEVGQKEKETTINNGFTKIDSKMPRFLGDLSADPPVTGVPAGSTFYHTGTSKLRVLRGNSTWVNAA